MRRIILLLFAVLLSWAAHAQQRNFWTQVSENDIGKNLFADRSRPVDFLLFSLQEPALRTELGNAPSERNVSARVSTFIVSFPNADGKPEQFRVVEAPVMEPGLEAKYPGIKSYAGKCIDDPFTTIRFDISPLGFHGMILSGSRPTVYIDPVDRATGTYLVVSRENTGPWPKFECSTPSTSSNLPGPGSFAYRNADDATLRTYRLAMAADGEYSQSRLTGEETNDAERRATIVATFNTHMTRVNGIFERDFGVRMILIANTDEVIYLDPDTDPWANGLTSVQICNATQPVMDAEILDANYDIGHLLLRRGDFGRAGCIGCVCTSGSKGSGFTSRSSWTSGNGFEEYILAHEMGHQFGANHTFSHADESTIAQVEPGSGNSLMSYAGITGAMTDIQSIMDDYFHAISIQQATDYVKAATCANESASGNNTPTANAGSDYTIPKSTPFKLTGAGTDADAGDVLVYNWEQMDVAPSFPWLPSTSATSGPAFKSVLPSGSDSRTFPVLANILDGSNTNKWEKLASVARTMNFRFTVRDNHPGAGNNESDDMVLTVNGSTGPFKVTAPNTNVSWCPGAHTVTWDVAGTNGAPINTANVKISMSTNGGLTFPIVLASSTANDGTQEVNIPCTYSTMGRIKVEAIGNIYFDISDANFTAGDGTPPTFTAPANVTIYKDANCLYDASTAITGDVTDEADNCDNSVNATSSDGIAPGGCVGELVITRTWTATDDCGNSTVKVQTITVTDNTPPTFTVPPDITIYKDANCNHDASVGATGDVLDEADNCDNTLDATFTDVTVPGSCVGEEIITRKWKLTDDCGNATTKFQVITVRDVTGPVISNVSATPSMLWPPNHKMRDVVVAYNAVDNCSPVTNSLSVTSNEPVNGNGDGNTSPDWIVIDDHNVKLRAERSGNGNGRIYTITIRSEDDCGNVSTTTTEVHVPHSNSGNTRAVRPLGEEGLQANVLPNPSAGDFNIFVLSSNEKERISLSVYDLYGRTIETRWVNNNSTIELGANYRPGVYVVRINQGELHKEMKLIKLPN